MNKILSITVPSYNTSNYMDFCLPTFLTNNELLDDIEILLVNDGSKDDTLSRARKYEKQYPNTIKVIDKKNGGHGSTINKGIEHATGKYFKVVDGDDWVDNLNLTRLVQQLKKLDVDMIVNPYIEYNERKKSENIISVEQQYLEKKMKFSDLNLKSVLPMHSITYSTSILKENKIHLDEKIFYVDVEYILYPIPFVKTIYFLDYPVYIYRYDTPNQSVNTKNTQKNVLHHLKVVNSVCSFYDSLSEKTSKSVKEYILSRTISLINSQYNIYFSFPHSKKMKYTINEFDKLINKNYPSIYNNNKYNPFVKAFRINNNFYYIIWLLNKIRLKMR
ncbi:glycosyltransferase family 2 protein [Enterococcus dongliensis]|uniref:glycosyltransferase family 2 protein n=1 Tax=Enterococcus dongliensis TaxID=2559925 RepID=UPI00288E281A|nr:glycosyltransferase family 2 protein [Enterococcus dongliensis]MDT2703451.1 glycosyltransferase family 2 protein [Enterococcus dongliensis]